MTSIAPTRTLTADELQTQRLLRANQLHPVALISEPQSFASPATVHAMWGDLLGASATQQDAVRAAQYLSKTHPVYDVTGNVQQGGQVTGVFQIDGGPVAGRRAVARLAVDVGMNTPFTDFGAHTRPSDVITPIAGPEMRTRFQSQRLFLESAPVRFDVVDRTDPNADIQSVTARLTALVDDQGVIHEI